MYEISRADANDVLGNEILELLGDSELIERAIDDIVSMSIELDFVDAARSMSSERNIDAAWNNYLEEAAHLNKMLTGKGAFINQVVDVHRRLARHFT